MPCAHLLHKTRAFCLTKCLQKSALALMLGVCILFFGGCVSPPKTNTAHTDAATMTTGARRADPGYVQYLERLSMLGSHAELARVVSGSQLAWLRAADAPLPEPLLVLADTWLYINPLMMMPDTKRSVFATLSSPLYWQMLSRARINGMYIAPAHGAGGLWAYNRKASRRGDDVIQHSFSETAGKDEEYFHMLNTANTNRKLLGLDITPAATGLGPDFFLATRNHRQFPGAYCMVELPSQVWPNMPAIENQWSGIALSDEQVKELARQNLLPPAMVQDAFTEPGQAGWAVTGEIHGVDGLMRRWAYRYHGSPDRPVLNWGDPSAAARRILSGSAVRNVGMLGGALVGMRLDGLYGLDMATTNPEGNVRRTAAPADETAIALSREIRRYGGWSWLRDEVPLNLMQSLMHNGPDFFQDAVFSPGLEHALLTGSTRLLNLMVDEALALQLDMRRIVHAMPGDSGINYTMPHLAERMEGLTSNSVITPRIAEEFRKSTLTEMQNAVISSTMTSPHGSDIAPLANKRLYTTATGLSALALGVGNAHSVTPEMLPAIRDGHLLQVFFRAMLPGLFMLSGQDIAGSLPLSWYHMAESVQEWDVSLASRGAYALTQATDSIPVTARGMGKTRSLYPTADVQLTVEDSFIAHLARILSIRSGLNIANAKLHGRFVTHSPGSFALALLLPAKLGRGIEDTPLQNGGSRVDELAPTHAFHEARAEKRPSPAEQKRMKREEEMRLRGELQKQIIASPQPASGFTPGEGALITLFNFSRETITETIDVSASPTLARIHSKGGPVLVSPERMDGVLKTKPGAPREPAGDSVRMRHEANTITVILPPWRAAAILIGKAPT